MRTKYLFVLFAVLAALLLPCAAHAQCSDFYCETFAVYNPGSGTITGYSLYDDYGISWGWWLEVQSYVSDPTGYNNPVGQSWGYDYVEVDFCYTPTMNGGYTAWGYNYYDLEVWWVYDGDSYSPGVYVSGPPGQQITSCPSPSWVLGGNNVAIYGSGFSQSTPSLSWSGNGGVDFLNGDSWVQVYSDVEIMVYADLSPLSTQGTLALTAGTAACQMQVPPIPAPPPTCYYPASETSTKPQDPTWCQTCPGGVFTAQLLEAGGALPPGGRYSGRQVSEVLSNESDTCYWPNSQYAQLTQPPAPGPPWTIGLSNSYGSDLVGVGNGWMGYYQGIIKDGTYTYPNGTCGESDTQAMSMNACTSGGQPYQYNSHTDSVSITSSQATAARGDASVSGPAQ